MQIFSHLYTLLVYGKEKAVTGGIVAGGLSLLALVGVTGEITVKELLTSIATWVVAHLAVYLKSNRG